MKTAKRVLAIIVTLVMIVGTCAVAASAAETLQSQINRGATEITLTKDTYETLTVNRDLTINLNGYRLLSVPGSAAIKISGGNVVVTDGQVISRYANVPSAQMLQEVWTNSPPAIRITGGSVTVEGVRIVGGMVRVPTTTDYFVPSGSGIQSYNGAEVTIKRCSIYGDYGVNNAVRANNVPGADVVIEDAIILSYTKAIKGGYVVAEGSEEIIAADRIAGVLNDGIRLEADEKKLIKNIFDERVIIVTKTAEELTTACDENTPLVTITEGEDLAEIEAPVLDYTWPNTKGTDCSYKLVPESILLSDGTEAPLDAADANLVTEESEIRYRVEFKMSDEARPYIEMLTKEGLENPLDGCLAWAGEEIEHYYAIACNNTRTTYVDSYDELIAEIGKLIKSVDEAGNVEVAGVDIRTLDEYVELRQYLYKLAGVTGWNAKNTGYAFTERQYRDIFGADAVMPADGYVGILDKVDALKTQLEGFRPFTDTSKWGDIAAWAYNTAYPMLLEVMEDLASEEDADNNGVKDGLLYEIQAVLQTGNYPAIIEALGLESQVALLDEGIGNAAVIYGKIQDAFAIGDVQATLDTVERHKDEIKYYVDKAVSVINNWRTYITPEDFIDGDFVTTYSTLGPIEIEYVEEATGALHITVVGSGTVAYSGGTVVNGSTTDEAFVDFADSFTVTAIDDDEFEFLFWVNKDAGSNRILSTEKTFTMNTNIDRDIEAVFNAIDEPVAYFTNPTGDICGNADVVDGALVMNEDIATPYIANYSFDGWPAVEVLPAAGDASATAYFAGNSVFADLNAYYGPDGAVLFVRPGSTSYIITPVYSTNGTYTVTYYDANGATYTATGKYNQIATKTSDFGASAYWKDTNTGEIVCVTSTYPYQIIDNASFTAVSGACPVDTVTRTTVVDNGTDTIFYVERSTTKAIKTTGIVYSTTVTEPQIGMDGVKKGTAKFTTQTGLYAPSFYSSDLVNKTVYVRPYIEFANGDIYYGDVVTN